jgi:hypothetical protein
LGKSLVYNNAVGGRAGWRRRAGLFGGGQELVLARTRKAELFGGMAALCGGEGLKAELPGARPRQMAQRWAGRGAWAGHIIW